LEQFVELAFQLRACNAGVVVLLQTDGCGAARVGRRRISFGEEDYRHGDVAGNHQGSTERADSALRNESVGQGLFESLCVTLVVID
tara:strand:+ start:145 stop:402 length:258 start_codon:yes stop_codon:yes gene_type:complete